MAAPRNDEHEYEYDPTNDPCSPDYRCPCTGRRGDWVCTAEHEDLDGGLRCGVQIGMGPVVCRACGCGDPFVLENR